jgi:hypothetical protein
MHSLTEVAAAVEASGAPSVLASLSGAALKHRLELGASLRRYSDQFNATNAGEVARRSEFALGDKGLARAGGYKSTEHMVQVLTGVGRQEAAKLVKVGALLNSAEPVAVVLTEAFEAGLPIDSVDALRRGLGDADAPIEAAELIAGAGRRTPEELFRSARHTRDLFDEEKIAVHEKERSDLRSVKTWWDDAGMFCGTWRLSPEEGSIIATAFDAILSPRRGGPRFVSKPAVAIAPSPFTDERTPEQILADGLVDVIRLGVDADPGILFGKRRPAVRVMVTDTALHNRAGHGVIEGTGNGGAGQAISFTAVERHLCDTGAISVGFDDDGQCVNIGRNQRLFTEKQRIGMAVRDGGCIADGCDRPPSYCEAHHVNQWLRDDGRTDIADGVLLCRRHHLLFHNAGWQIIRDKGTYYLRPPTSVDPLQKLIKLRSRNPIMEELRVAREQVAREQVACGQVA